MPERTYIITVDPTDTSMDVAGLFAFLRSGKGTAPVPDGVWSQGLFYIGMRDCAAFKPLASVTDNVVLRSRFRLGL